MIAHSVCLLACRVEVWKKHIDTNVDAAHLEVCATLN